MQTRNRLLDDLAKVTGGALSVMTGVKSEAEAVMRQQFEKVPDKMGLIPREDFEAVRTMAAKARDQQEELVKRVAVLEAALKIKPPSKTAKTTAKTTKKKPGPKKAGKTTKAKTAPKKAGKGAKG
jgi:BMFP domain-containing protein YqiC